MLSRGNEKLGPLIHHFSLPAGATCPGETEACAQDCYAMQHFFRMPDVKARLHRNWQGAQSDTFVEDLVLDIRKQRARNVRVHSAGDFYDPGYVDKWVAITKRLPGVRFFAYTRSWRIPEIRRRLDILNRRPNFITWWSTDRDTHRIDGEPPRWKGVRVAYMAKEYDEEIPGYVDLVFRVKRRAKVEKYRDGRLVCCAEQGVKRQVKITCTDCGICFNDGAIPQKALVQLGM